MNRRRENYGVVGSLALAMGACSASLGPLGSIDGDGDSEVACHKDSDSGGLDTDTDADVGDTDTDTDLAFDDTDTSDSGLGSPDPGGLLFRPGDFEWHEDILAPLVTSGALVAAEGDCDRDHPVALTRNYLGDVGVVVGYLGASDERIATLQYDAATSALVIERWATEAVGADAVFDPLPDDPRDFSCNTVALESVLVGTTPCVLAALSGSLGINGRNGGRFCDDASGFVAAPLTTFVGAPLSVTSSLRDGPFFTVDLDRDGVREVWAGNVPRSSSDPDPDSFAVGQQCSTPELCVQRVFSDLFEDDGRVSGLDNLYGLVVFGEFASVIGAGAGTAGTNPSSLWRWNPGTSTYQAVDGELEHGLFPGLDPSEYSREQVLQRAQPMGMGFFSVGSEAYWTVTTNVSFWFLMDPASPSQYLPQITKVASFHLGSTGDVLSGSLAIDEVSERLGLASPARTDNPAINFTPWGVNTQLSGLLLIGHGPDHLDFGATTVDPAPEGIVGVALDSWIAGPAGHDEPNYAEADMGALGR